MPHRFGLRRILRLYLSQIRFSQAMVVHFRWVDVFQQLWAWLTMSWKFICRKPFFWLLLFWFYAAQFGSKTDTPTFTFSQPQKSQSNPFQFSNVGPFQVSWCVSPAWLTMSWTFICSKLFTEPPDFCCFDFMLHSLGLRRIPRLLHSLLHHRNLSQIRFSLAMLVHFR